MPEITGGAKVGTMRFEFNDNGTPRTALVQLTARLTTSPFTDVTVQVGTILAQAIAAETGYTLTLATITEETTTQVFPAP
jgi:hypothetical protein